MSSPIGRRERLPNANNPRVLTRLLELIAEGTRGSRALSEVLECDIRTVQYYLQAGVWLRLLDDEDLPTLTKLGLEYVFGGRRRKRVYAEAVWANTTVQAVFGGMTKAPPAGEIAARLQRLDPTLAPTTARRRATAVRGLVSPALRFKPKVAARSEQLGLGFPMAASSTAEQVLVDVDSVPGSLPALEAYLYVYRQLLAHGELSPGHVRALLDQAGGRDCAVGDYIDLALRRGDAWRVGEHLVVSRGAVERRELVDGVLGVAFSDPAYRSYVKLTAQIADGHNYGRLEHERGKRRFEAWDKRVFGEPLQPHRLAEHLDRILLGRPIDVYPLAERPGPELPHRAEPFLDLVEASGVALAAPPSLRVLGGGVRGVNQVLQRARAVVSAPMPTDARVRVHGGLVAPGARPLRSVPDTVSLRLRALSHVPHLALVTALLLAHRRAGFRIALEHDESGLGVTRERERLGSLDEVLAGFCEQREWVLSTSRYSLPATELLDLLQRLGVAVKLRTAWALNEDLFLRFREEPEDRELYGRLRPLEDAVARFLDEWV